MRKYVNFIFLISLSICPLITVIDSLQMGLCFGVTLSVMFFMLVNFIFGLEKIANKDVRTFVYAVLAAGFIILIKFIASKLGVATFVEFGKRLDISIVSLLLLGFYPIYNDTKMTTEDYAERTFYMGVIFIVACAIYGASIEILAYGNIWGVNLGFAGLEIFRQPFAGMFLIAVATAIVNMIRVAILNRKKKYNLLVDKYTLQIKTIIDNKNKEEKNG